MQCTQGHAVCEKCQTQLSECPHCRGAYVGTRNYVLEEVIAKLKVFVDNDTAAAAAAGVDATTTATPTITAANKKKKSKKAKKAAAAAAAAAAVASGSGATASTTMAMTIEESAEHTEESETVTPESDEADASEPMDDAGMMAQNLDTAELSRIVTEMLRKCNCSLFWFLVFY